jgi:hypothetical protein
VFMHLFVCMYETEIKVVGEAIKCDNLERAVFVNRIEYKKNVCSISSPRPLNICALFFKTCVS